MVGRDRVHDGVVTAAGAQYAAREDHDADDHGDAAERIGEGHSAEPTKRREQNGGDAENRETGDVAVAGDRLE